MATQIHHLDVGTRVKVKIVDENSNFIDISSASELLLLFKKPGIDTPVQKTASFMTDGTDGWVEYVMQADDLDTIGTWKIQGRVTLPTGVWSSTIKTFKVFKNLDS